MEIQSSISISVKVIACFAFALALVFFQPAASHAASGMHGDHHAATTIDHHSDDSHPHDADTAVPLAAECGSASSSNDEEASTGQCCNGICLSVILVENGPFFVDLAISGGYLVLLAQSRSIAPSGFLRPPQFLI